MRSTTNVIGGTVGGMLALGLMIGGCGEGGSTPSAHTTSPTTSAPATTTAPEKSSAPAMTAGQQQAVTSAESYLSSGQGFSKAGLMQQLTSSAGEGFSKANAAFAIKHLHPNWDKQAVISAESYLSSGQGFSKAGLMQQLTSSAGEGFTHAQAVYAINDLHPNWDKQAVISAKSYLSSGQGFSRAGLIQQLTSSAGEGFTHAQAVYAVNKVGL